MPLILVKPGAITPNSSEYFAVCGLAGILSCGLTHAALTPVDMVKCNKQNNPDIFTKGMFGNMKILSGYKGVRGLGRGVMPTFVGYSFQGLGKFGLNDMFKHKYGQLLGDDFKQNNPRIFYAMCSGSAEFFADMLLCPWETVKLKVQTVDMRNWLEGKSNGYANGITDGTARLVREEGLPGCFNILKALWGRQIPYTIVKFVAFEEFIRGIYGITESKFGKTKADYGKNTQLVFTFGAGYGAGIFCCLISHPLDAMAFFISKSPGTPAGELYKADGGFPGLWKGLAARIFMIDIKIVSHLMLLQRKRFLMTRFDHVALSDG